MVSKKRRDNLIKAPLTIGTPLSSSDSEMAFKVIKNRRSMFEKKEMHFYSLRTYDYALFNNKLNRPDFLLKPLKSMLNFEVYISQET